jgi:hypothetical protein
MSGTEQRVDPRPNKADGVGSLIVSANVVVDGSDTETIAVPDGTSIPVRWVGGFSYLPETCDGGGTFDPSGTTLPSPDVVEAQIDVTPFEVEGSDQVSGFGVGSPALIEERLQYARRNYLACESKQIEAELWKGTLSTSKGWGNRFLADANVDLVEGDRLLGYRTALAVLERAINDGTCGQQGMIHARADTVTMWVSDHLVRRVGNILVTELGTIVVAGSGYDGSAPAAGTLHLDPRHAGQVPSSDSAWAYATPVVDLRRSDWANPQPILERFDASTTTAVKTNRMTTYARKYVAVTWPCFQAGVHVDHDNAMTVTGS